MREEDGGCVRRRDYSAFLKRSEANRQLSDRVRFHAMSSCHPLPSRPSQLLHWRASSSHHHHIASIDGGRGCIGTRSHTRTRPPCPLCVPTASPRKLLLKEENRCYRHRPHQSATPKAQNLSPHRGSGRCIFKQGIPSPVSLEWPSLSISLRLAA